MAKANSLGISIIYKSLERYIMLAFQIIVQIVLARLLSPSDYGVVAMMAVFIAISNVFIHNGFNMAIVQKKEATEIDYATSLTLNFIIGLTIYIILFVSAPYISTFYKTPDLTQTLRVLALVLPIGSISSIQSAIATRKMLFRSLFVCNLCGSFVSGIIGVSAAYLGFGFWALIMQQLSSVIIVSIASIVVGIWKPKFGYNKTSAFEMYSFGSKLLLAGLINQAYNQLNSLVIGRKYSASDLAFYTKGKMFPDYITSGVDSALQAVSLSAFAKKQNDLHALHCLMTRIITANTFITFPLLGLLALCADQIVSIVLTDKWLPIVPYLRLCCVTFAFHPMTSICLQSISALGRSDARLKMEYIKKPIGIILLILLLEYGPLGVAVSALLTSIIGILITIYYTKIIVKYSIYQLFQDIYPSILISVIMGLCVIMVKSVFDTNPFILLLTETLVGICVYLALSVIFRVNGLQLFLRQIKKRNK